MNNTLLIACAGAGKTTYLVNEALKLIDKKILITTFTDENTESIARKIINQNKSIPNNVCVRPWFTFLLEHCVRPFQGKLIEDDITGLLLVQGKSGLRYKTKNNIPVYWPEENIENHYFSPKMEIYSDKIAKFAVKSNKLNNNLVIQRIKSLYDYIFIDEIQDMAGYDFELISNFMKLGIKVIMVGDPRQSTLQTHYDGKYKKYSGYNIKNFFVDHCKDICYVDEKTLNTSHRCNYEIIKIANSLYPEFIDSGTDFEEKSVLNGLFFIHKNDVGKFLQTITPVALRYDKRYYSGDLITYNIGKSKGLEFDNTLLYLTKNMIQWFLGDSQIEGKTKSSLYIALTRSRFSCTIVLNDDKYLSRLQKFEFNGVNLYKLKK